MKVGARRGRRVVRDTQCTPFRPVPELVRQLDAGRSGCAGHVLGMQRHMASGLVQRFWNGNEERVEGLGPLAEWVIGDPEIHCGRLGEGQRRLDMFGLGRDVNLRFHPGQRPGQRVLRLGLNPVAFGAIDFRGRDARQRRVVERHENIIRFPEDGNQGRNRPDVVLARSDRPLQPLLKQPAHRLRRAARKVERDQDPGALTDLEDRVMREIQTMGNQGRTGEGLERCACVGFVQDHRRLEIGVLIGIGIVREELDEPRPRDRQALLGLEGDRLLPGQRSGRQLRARRNEGVLLCARRRDEFHGHARRLWRQQAHARGVEEGQEVLFRHPVQPRDHDLHQPRKDGDQGGAAVFVVGVPFGCVDGAQPLRLVDDVFLGSTVDGRLGTHTPTPSVR